MTESKDEIVKDVVCGMKKPKNQMLFNSEYNGSVYYFCSKMDKDMFDARPDRWVTKRGEGR